MDSRQRIVSDVEGGWGGVVGKLKKAQVKDNDSTDCRANNKLWIIHGWKERI
jgi:hypothetical protein